MGRQSRPLTGSARPQGGPWVRRSAPANFGAPLPSLLGVRRVRMTIWHDSPPGCAARQRSRTGQHFLEKRTMPKFLNQTSAGADDARLLRFARNDVDRLADAVIARSAQRDEAISATRVDRRVLAERTRGLVLAKRTRAPRRPNGFENVQNDRTIRVLSSLQSLRLRRVGTKVLWLRLRLPGLRDCRRKGMPPANNHRRNIMGSGP